MISDKTYTYLTDWLTEAIRPEYEKADIEKFTKASKPSYLTSSRLSDFVEKNVYRGKEKLFRIDSDGKLFVYNGEYFEEASDECFMEVLIENVFQNLGVGVMYRKIIPPRVAKQCMKHIRNTESCKYEPDRRYICFTNGVLDLKDKKLKGFSIRYCTDIVLDFPYDERASCLLWNIKIKEIIPNTDFRRAFQMFCGSLLIKREELKVEYLCYLIGSGSNGKSVISQAVANVFGEKYYSTFTPKQLFKEGNSSSFNMHELQGKILNLVDDLDVEDFSGGTLKRFISGEKFKARGAYSREYVMVQPPLILCCTNDIPDTSDDSYGHHRRQLPIHTTTKQFIGEERDTSLTAKLSTVEARQGIFGWILDGYRKVVSNGGDIKLGEPVKRAIEELRADSSPMRRWLRDGNYCSLPEADSCDPRWRPLKELFAEYTAYCNENGYPKTSDSRAIAKMLRSIDCISKRGGRGIMYLVGRKGIDTDATGGLIMK